MGVEYNIYIELGKSIVHSNLYDPTNRNGEEVLNAHKQVQCYITKQTCPNLIENCINYQCMAPIHMYIFLLGTVWKTITQISKSIHTYKLCLCIFFFCSICIVLSGTQVVRIKTQKKPKMWYFLHPLYSIFNFIFNIWSSKGKTVNPNNHILHEFETDKIVRRSVPLIPFWVFELEEPVLFADVKTIHLHLTHKIFDLIY